MWNSYSCQISDLERIIKTFLSIIGILYHCKGHVKLLVIVSLCLWLCSQLLFGVSYFQALDKYNSKCIEPISNKSLIFLWHERWAQDLRLSWWVRQIFHNAHFHMKESNANSSFCLKTCCNLVGVELDSITMNKRGLMLLPQKGVNGGRIFPLMLLSPSILTTTILSNVSVGHFIIVFFFAFEELEEEAEEEGRGIERTFLLGLRFS